MQKMLNKHIKNMQEEKVLDVGSQDVNGSYKPLFKNAKSYHGADMEKAKNVDIVMQEFKIPMVEESYSLVVSGQCLEHCRNPFLLVGEMYRVLEENGIVILIAPWTWEVHRYPIDCFRILPDGMKAILDLNGFKVIDLYKHGRDCIGVGLK